MYTPEFHSYHAVTMLSDLDFFALDHEHMFMMRWHQTRVSINCRRYGSIVISPAQKYVSYGLDCGLVHDELINLIS